MAPKKASAAAAVKLAHELLTKARDEGGEESVWENIFARLRKVPAALARPEPRKLSLLHQAAYWGQEVAVTTLLEEFSVDPGELTADDEPEDAASVAETQGHHAVAALLKAALAKSKEEIVAKAAKAEKAVKAAPSAEDVKTAHELLSEARDSGSDDAAWASIFKKLRERPAALARPEPRKLSLLQQAAYWGNMAAVKTLLAEFGADPRELTADGEDHNAADVAAAQGHTAVAALLRDAASKAPGVSLADAPSSSAVSGSASGEDEALAASSPYLQTKASNVPDDLKGCVTVWLCLQPDGSGTKSWELLSPADNAAIEAARGAGDNKAKLSGGRSVDLSTSRLIASGAAGDERQVCSFRVLWEWDSGEGGKSPPVWQSYAPDAQWQLEAAMCSKAASSDVAAAEGKKYLVDLVGFRQHSASDPFRTRRVRRRGVPLREPFPPKVRDVESGSWLDLSVRPDYWASGAAATAAPPTGSASGSLSAAETARRYDLPLDSPIVASISAWMNGSIRTGHAAAYGQVAGHGGPTKGMQVVRVEVVQQPAMWRRYCRYRAKLKLQSAAIAKHAGTAYLKKNPMAMPECDWLDRSVNEAYFWHGSGKSPDGSVDLVDAIVSCGHEPSDENGEVMEVSDGASSRFAKNTSMFGSGVYLADIASKANLYVPCSVCHQGSYFRDPCHCSKKDVDAAPPYRMLLCRAALGRVYVEKKYSEERYKGEFNPARKLGADAVMGEAVKGQLAFREYVVYNDSASYPEFIVHFKRLPHALKGDPFGMPPAKKPKKK
eukprot:TRINITY_DN26297_c0_g1_i1.p1 TRINITY_DN26297_c0_g1~~TRINITY_DN26297_c0_g1_i1.p1  ORF type:complete len:779 (-),score=181.39 TRINITY_DN26297_c0_g1_i1:37-2373(-)